MFLDEKIMASPPTRSSQMSPSRRPRFQRSENYQSSYRKRSISINSLSSKSASIDQPNISIKFVKPVKHDGSSIYSPLKASKDEQRMGMLIESRINQYKKEVTPAKRKQSKITTDSLSYLEKLIKQAKELEQRLVNKEIEIAELEDNNDKLRKKLINFEQIKEQNEKLVLKSTKMERELMEKHALMSLLEDTLKKSEVSLAKTRSSLDKLRKEIQDNRIQELQKQKNLLCEKIRILESRIEFQHQQVQKMDNINRKLERDIEDAIVMNQKLERQLYARSAVASILKEQSLTHQIENLKKQLACSQSLNEKYLEQIIDSQKSQIVQLKSVNKSLYVKLDILVKKLQDKNKTNKKENKQQKSKQFIELQSKYRKLLLDFKSFRQEHNEVLKKNLQYKKLQGKPRANILERDDSIVSLSYSMTSERASQ